jgi:hypothetical protein
VLGRKRHILTDTLGLLKAPSQGSAVVVGSPAITSVTLARRQRSPASP